MGQVKSRICEEFIKKHKKRMSKIKIHDTSVMYFVLAFLPLRQVLHMQLLSKKFANVFVPVTFNMMTSRGTIENGPTKQKVLMFTTNTSKDPIMLRTPIHPIKYMDFQKQKEQFFSSKRLTQFPDYTQHILPKRSYWNKMKWE